MRASYTVSMSQRFSRAFVRGLVVLSFPLSVLSSGCAPGEAELLTQDLVQLIMQSVGLRAAETPEATQ